MKDEDLRYYRHRLADERTRAENAAEPGVGAVHRQLAELYERRLAEEGSLRTPG